MAFHIKLSNGERINAAVFDKIYRVDDTKLSNNCRSIASLSAYKKHFKVDGTVPVPTVKITEVSNYEASSPRKIPQEYIVYQQRSKEDYDSIVEYDYDDEDYHWLCLLNNERRKKKEKEIDHESFELVMDRLEKECIFEPTSMVGNSSCEGDDVCCVCSDGDATNVNQIIYCDMCNIAVHQDCYGVPYIPAGQWLCRKCKLSPSTPVECCLCPNSGGAYKQTTDGRWAHVICAIWLNEVHFGNAVFLESIEGVDNSLRRRAKLKCIVCRQKMGACLQCSTKSCLKAFHVTCAQNSGMSMQVRAKEDKNQEDGVDVQRFVYCHLHADDEEEGSDFNTRKKRMENAIRHARRDMANNLGQAATNINMPVVPKPTLEGIEKRVNISIADIHQYWFLKRKSRCGTPLIRRLQMQLSGIKRVSPQFELTDEDKEICEGMKKVRVAWEHTRLLCELVKKREAAKLSHVSFCKDMSDLLIKPIQSSLEETLDILEKKDKNDVFATPVIIEGYKNVIKHPMDLLTMRKRVKEGKIASFAELRNDFILMMDNCSKFNAQNEWYLNYGKRFRKTGNMLISEAESSYIQREKLLNDPEYSKELVTIKFYESLRALNNEEVPEEDQIAVNESRILYSDNFASVDKKSTPSKQMRKLIAAPTITKRKIAEAPASNISRSKRKKEDIRTPKIYHFFSPRKVNTPVPVPLMAYRDNTAVKSPLPADMASSESSTEDDDSIMIRRSSRLLENVKLNGDSGDESQFLHNDLVVVNGTAGRVIDPVSALIDDQLPQELLSECRVRRRDSRICVLLFETENKWGWYNPTEIKHLDMGENKGVAPKSISRAKSWYRRIIDTFTFR